eukprot:TRINITY_DN2981_c0_g1_i4.p1 TRINITY_DN2981_c0_g1~~TRINITY_DN2981_c0_g1_i4.p1  ORF type:complete len:698 (-),score=155.62 TRINITY_DN2981_c0_g1_i4:45-2138(-)
MTNKLLFVGCLLLVFVCAPLAIVCQDEQVYDGKKGTLVNGWQNWSWAKVNFASGDVAPPSGDSFSISMLVSNWTALYMHNDQGVLTSSFTTLQFKAHGGSVGNQPLLIQLIVSGNPAGSYVDINAYGGPLQAGKWVTIAIPMTSFNIPASTPATGFWLQSNTANDAGTAYFDDFVFLSKPLPPPSNITVTVMPAPKPTYTLSNMLFGINWASAAQLAANKYTANRWGGNAVTRYAWDLDVQNHASDWFFEGIPNPIADESKLPYGTSSDAFINTTLQAGAEPIVTLPMIGWSPKDRTYRWSFSVAKYGAQQKTDPYHTDAGNGIKTDGKTDVVGNDPTDTDRPIDPSYVVKWLDHITEAFGPDKVKYFEMDNEPGLWSSTHRDVHPAPLSYDELWNRTLLYASAIKAKYPNVKLMGPVPWGWCAYLYSPQDGCSAGPDQAAHGGLKFMEYYISKVAEHKKQTGVQLIDYVDFHYYPQENGVLSSQEDAATVALRFRTIRGLWDPTYVDESWIAAPIYIIPRIKAWIQQYMGQGQMGIAMSEFTWGDDDIITGALAQVIALNTCAKEGVQISSRWVAPASNTRTELAYQLHTNYDGAGAHISGTVLNATSSADLEVSSFAYAASGGVYYVVLVNKVQGPVGVKLDLSGLGVKTGNVVLYSFWESTTHIMPVGKAALSNGAVDMTLQGWSATLAVVYTV